jgi:vitamin B12 transporter
MSYAVAFSRARTDGVYAFNNDYRNVVWSAQLRATPDERTEAKLAVRYTDSEYRFPTDYTGAPVDSNAFRVQERVVGAIEVARSFSDRVEGRVLVALNGMDAANDDRPDGPADTLGFYGSKDLQTISRRSVDGRINIRPVPAMVITGGIHIERQVERRLSESESQFGSFSGSSDAERLNRGYYVQLHAEPAGAIAFTVGSRVDDNETFGTFFTRRGGVTYRFGGGVRIRASAGTAFKEPSFFENFSENPFARGNPDLDPERSTSWEVGAEHEVGNGRLRFAGTYFVQRFRDLIQYTATAQSPGDPNFFNIAQANAAGFEAEGRGTIAAGLTVGAGYTYLRTQVVDAGYDSGPGAAFVEGERLLRRPAHSFQAEAAYRFPDRGSLTANVRVVGRRDDRDFGTFPATPVVLEAYATLDVAAELIVLEGERGTPTVTASGRMANLLNELYQPVFGFRAPGRTVHVGAKIVF